MQPIALIGNGISLEPMAIAHVSALTQSGLPPDLWYSQPAAITTEDDMRGYVQTSLDDQQHGTGLPFVIVDLATGQVIGNTRTIDIALQHFRRVPTPVSLHCK